jgi:hypothetical protein
MRYTLILVVAFALAGCAQEQVQIAPRDLAPVEVEASALPTKPEVEARKQMAFMTVNEAVQGFRVMQRRYPNNLMELIDTGLLAELPDLPGAMRFAYDPAEGKVEILVESVAQKPVE